MALLARIELDKKETEKLQKDLGAILNYVSQLKEAPLKKEETASIPVGPKAPKLSNIFRKDEPISDQSDLQRGDYIKVKHIL